MRDLSLITSYNKIVYSLPYLCTMTKALGIDFGMKRTGLAITDDHRIIASPLTAVASDVLMTYLIQLFTKNKISTIVLGFPTSVDGTDTHITENVRLLKEALEKQFVGTEVILQDERYTSQRAMQVIHQGGKAKHKKDKGLVDTISATLILQDYLAGV